ncbi:hypothetical protein A1O3_00318 [Capronia epimyces CBS 606.96]|uniref:Uncharacterized protein n=1 Tax=Capronia epimyces CBS 606.96 TaxID=1182542 RepID=W9YGT8_9EURO|nr:uncharacterized protein A1O3_00318 [Capronia epimyces CBS 606.96]EXJ91768.1 hypothetical protein A1O3_00318 [Capronia epimyces CBS 606.96]
MNTLLRDGRNLAPVFSSTVSLHKTTSLIGRLNRYGWGVLCVAGGGAYYFAKKSINADRAARYEAEQKRKARQYRLEANSFPYNDAPPTKAKKAKSQTNSNGETKGLDHAGSPSSEISEDAAPVGHAPVDSEQRVREKSKYEAAEPYRSKKGDRFS